MRRDPKAGWIHPHHYVRDPNGLVRKVRRQLEVCRCGCGRAPTGRRTTFYSDDCVHNWKIRTDPGYVRAQLWKRDKGVCQECGLDTGLVRDAIQDLQRHHPYGFGTTGRKWMVENQLRLGKTLWEAHHVVPVSEGGGLCGLEGYASVCIWCHRVKTAELRKRLKEKRLHEDSTGN